MAALSLFSWNFEGTEEEKKKVYNALEKFAELVTPLIGNESDSFHDEGKIKDAAATAFPLVLKDFERVNSNATPSSKVMGEINRFLEFILKANAENRRKAEKANEALIEKLVEEYKTVLQDFSEADAALVRIEQLQELHADTKLTQVNRFLREGSSGNSEFQQSYQKKLEEEMDKYFTGIENEQKLKLQNFHERDGKIVGEAVNEFEEQMKVNGLELGNKCAQEMAIKAFISNFIQTKNPYPKGSQELEVFIQILKPKLEAIVTHLELKVEEERVNAACPEKAPMEALSICETFFNSKMNEEEGRSRSGFLEEHEITMAYKTALAEAMAKYIHLKDCNCNASSTHANLNLWNQTEEELKDKLGKNFERRRTIHKQRKVEEIKKAEEIVSKSLEEYTKVMNSAKDGTINGPEDFKMNHQMAKESALRLFEEMSRWEDSEFFMAFQNKLRDSIEWSKQDFYSLFQSRIFRENSMIDETIESCEAVYHKEMEYRFDGLNFIKSERLKKSHEVASQAFMTKCRQQYNRPMSPYQLKRVEDKLRILQEHYERINAMTLNSKAPAPAIGIDLGTTYSCVAVYYNGKVHVVPYFNSMGQHTIPSYVAFKIKENGEWDTTIGTAAKDSAPLDPVNTIYDVKRLIGRKFWDPSVKENLKSCGWPFKVIDGKDGVPRIEVFGGKRYFSPEEVSGKLLRVLRKMTADFLGINEDLFTKVVVTHPASFNDGQKQATKDAAKLAGFEEITLLNEPTAAAVAYSLERLRGNADKVLVFDYGGGTLDVCLINVKKDEVEVLATEGDPKCGGRDLDKNLMNYCAEKFMKMNGNGKCKKFDIIAGMEQTKDLVLRSKCKRNWGRLQLKCEEAKISLSTGTEYTINVDNFCNDVDLKIPVSRETFEKLNESEFQKAIGCLTTLMQKNNIHIDEIDEIVLVGGSSRIPRVQELLEDIFLGKTLTKYIPPDHAVAYGAAIKAALHFGTETKERLQLEKIQDVISMSIGTDVVFKNIPGIYDVVIKKGTKIPTKVVRVGSEGYHTVCDNQTGMRFNIYQGERLFADDNELLGTFDLEGLRPERAGLEYADLCMEIDDDGILHVTATSVSGGHRKDLKVTALKYRLSDDYIQKILAEENARNKLTSIRGNIEKLAKEVEEFKDSCFAKAYSEIIDQLMNNWKELKGLEKRVEEFEDLKVHLKNSFQQISDNMKALRAKIHVDGKNCSNCKIVVVGATSEE